MVRGDLREALRHIRGLTALVVVLVFVAVGVAAGCGAGGPETADGAELPCGEAVLRDWSDGSIDRRYSADCYISAIDALPEDVRAYTSAKDDIARAAQSQSDGATATTGDAREARATTPERQLSAARAEAVDPSASGSLRRPPVPLLVLAGVGIALLAGVLAVTATRLVRRDG
jgi:hypothetical protein